MSETTGMFLILKEMISDLFALLFLHQKRFTLGILAPIRTMIKSTVQIFNNYESY